MKNKLIPFVVSIIIIVLITISCDKSTEPNATTGTLTDIDGNVYKTIKVWFTVVDG